MKDGQTAEKRGQLRPLFLPIGDTCEQTVGGYCI
jgi:hypothetical protein